MFVFSKERLFSKQRPGPRATAGLVGIALVGVPALIGSGFALGTPPTRSGPALAVLLVVALAAVAALALAWTSLRAAVEQDRRRAEIAQQVLSRATREQRERMHELRSTIAGLVSGSAMLDNPAVPPETRQRLWESVRRELDRMDRLLSGQATPTTELALDDALGRILELQRLKGRQVELHSTTDVVHARYDALAEVLNILVDNASTHGGVDRSVVEVVRRDDDTVDIRVSDDGRGIPLEQRAQIFDWGRRGADSPGEGIGLNVAQRLMTEDGGSLRLAEHQGRGSAFVITLPAARRPLDDLTLEAGRAWSH